MAEEKHYTRIDIERYLNHEMTNSEMHAFEVAIMNDPLLADAIEGYRSTDKKTSDDHLQMVRSQILNNETPARLIPFAARSTNWMKVAAVFVIIAAVSAVTYNWLGKSSQNSQLAAGTPENQSMQADSIGPAPLPLEDAVTTTAMKAKELKKKAPQPPFIKPEETETISQADAIAASSEAMNSSTGNNAIALQKEGMSRKQEAEEEKAAMATTAARSRQAAATSQFKMRGRVVDEEGEPLPFATITANNDRGTVSNANGEFSLLSHDSILQVSVAISGYQPLFATLKSSANNRIVASQAQEGLSETIVSAMGKSKAEKNTNPAGGMPTIGWEKYRQYIQKSIEHFQDSAQEYEAGTVELSFLTDRKGRPIDIKALRFNNKQNRDFAIELLKNGSAWKTSGDKRTTLVVEF